MNAFWNLSVTATLLVCLCAPGLTMAWELEKDEDGIRVYTREVSGSDFKEFKAVTRVKATLKALVALATDAGACPTYVETCTEGKLLKKVSDTERYVYTYNDAPWPVADRDAAVHNVITQDPYRKTVHIKMTAAPGKVEEKEDVVRIMELDAEWRFTPIDENTTEVFYRVKTEPGGDLPAWLVNSVIVDQPFETLTKMKMIIKSPQYKFAKVPFIKE